MITISANDVQLLEKMCTKIFELDPKIRFVGMISQLGKLITGGPRKGVSLFLDGSRHEMIFMEVALRVRMRHEYDLSFGPVNFTVSHRDRIIVISIPYRDKILYLSAEKDLDLHKILNIILDLIKRPDLL